MSRFTAAALRATVLATLALLAGCDRAPFSSAGGAGDNGWSQVGQDPGEQRYSKLDQINAANVGTLGLAWAADMPNNVGMQATPIVIDGTIYSSFGHSDVIAHDAVTGKLKWTYESHADAALAKSCCAPGSRGVAYANGKIFIGQLDGKLVALDAATGAKAWEAQTTDPESMLTITGAPRIAGGNVIIGNGGAEFGVRGYVTAYDVDTGKKAWRFYTVPGAGPDGEVSDEPLRRLAGPTWSGTNYLKWGGGGTVWDSMAYDPELDLLYIGVGNGSPWNPKIRSEDKGDNLFLSSIVALRPRTGEYVWHFQETPAEAWDFTATQHMILADLTIDGKPRKVIMQAPKNGFFYVIDRETGKFISGQKYYADTNWASGLDPVTGRPIENPEARYYRTGKPFAATPGSSGAHNWQPMAYSPARKLVYIPVHVNRVVFDAADDPGPNGLVPTVGVRLLRQPKPMTPAEIVKAQQGMTGWLLAWDPIAQKEVWRVPHKAPHNGGVLATAGDLVFQGTVTGQFNAYGAGDGKLLWSMPAQTGIVAAPMTYSVNGTQYVAVLAGFTGVTANAGGGFAFIDGQDPRGPNRLLVFKLGGTARLPAKPALDRKLDPPAQTGTPAMIAAGANLYARNCTRCHGFSAVAGGHPPDLRYSPMLHNGFEAVVYDGALKDRGMASFAKWLSKADVEAIRAYVVSRAWDAKNHPDQAPEALLTGAAR